MPPSFNRPHHHSSQGLDPPLPLGGKVPTSRGPRADPACGPLPQVISAREPIEMGSRTSRPWEFPSPVTQREPIEIGSHFSRPWEFPSPVTLCGPLVDPACGTSPLMNTPVPGMSARVGLAGGRTAIAPVATCSGRCRLPAVVLRRASTCGSRLLHPAGHAVP